MNITQAKSIPLIDLLRQLGYEPSQSKRGGAELWYRSPLREEKDASFHITVQRNIWFDFGLGKGGNILDFVMEHEHTDLSGALRFLDRVWGGGVSVRPQRKPSVQKATPSSSLSFIRCSTSLSPAIREYLTGRRIVWDQVSRFADEVIFRVKDREQFALGMKNQSGGWELRSSIFKGCIAPKDISVFQSTDAPFLSIFEGMFDFFSMICWQHPKPIQGTVVILHSTANIEKVKPMLTADSSFEKVYTFFDNDDTGQRVGEQLLTMTSIPIVANNTIYTPFNDASAWWQAQR